MKEFEEIIKSENKVLVKFGANWCGPCKIMDKILSEVQRDKTYGKRVYKVDVELLPELGAKYNIRNLPTCIIFQNGEVVERFTGRKYAKEIMEMLE